MGAARDNVEAGMTGHPKVSSPEQAKGCSLPGSARGGVTWGTSLNGRGLEEERTSAAGTSVPGIPLELAGFPTEVASNRATTANAVRFNPKRFWRKTPRQDRRTWGGDMVGGVCHAGSY